VRIVWQGFVDPVAQQPYVDRLVAYLNEIADPGFTYEFAGISPPDRYLHRLTEARCALQAVASAVDHERAGADAIVFGHFQDAGLFDARAALSVPVVGLGESAFLHACTLGWRFGLVTIDPVFVPWHEEQVAHYRLGARFSGVRAMRTSVEDYMRALTDAAAADAVVRQFEEQARELVAAGAEVLIPAGGLPALVLRDRRDFTIDGAVVLNPTAVAAKQAEVALKLRVLDGTAPSRLRTFAPPSAEALTEFLAAAGRMTP
jgi:allantoin racemase